MMVTLFEAQDLRIGRSEIETFLILFVVLRLASYLLFRVLSFPVITLLVCSRNPPIIIASTPPRSCLPWRQCYVVVMGNMITC